jgi:hypothetical protein
MFFFLDAAERKITYTSRRPRNPNRHFNGSLAITAYNFFLRDRSIDNNLSKDPHDYLSTLIFVFSD